MPEKFENNENLVPQSDTQKSEPPTDNAKSLIRGHLKPHSEVVQEKELEQFDPDKPTAETDPLYEKIKEKEKEMDEKIKKYYEEIQENKPEE